MPKVNIEIFYSIGNSERLPLKRTLEVPQRTSDQLVNVGKGDWLYEQAEALICDILKREIAPDVPIQNNKDLSQLGVTSLSYSFIDENGEQMGSTAIYPD